MDDGTRTHDNRDHNPGLYQLSYVHRCRLLHPGPCPGGQRPPSGTAADPSPCRLIGLPISRQGGVPGRTRTCDHRLRRPVLYPTELRARGPHRPLARTRTFQGFSSASCRATRPRATLAGVAACQTRRTGARIIRNTPWKRQFGFILTARWLQRSRHLLLPSPAHAGPQRLPIAVAAFRLPGRMAGAEAREVEWQLTAPDLAPVRRWLEQHNALDDLIIAAAASAAAARYLPRYRGLARHARRIRAAAARSRAAIRRRP